MDYVEKIELVIYLVDYLLRERNQDNGDVAYCQDLAAGSCADGGAGEGRAHAGTDVRARAAFATPMRVIFNTFTPRDQAIYARLLG